MTATREKAQTGRGAVLCSLDILDTPPEREFDDLADVVSAVMGCPFSAVSLVDGERQWFKARVGIDVQETSLDQSFCTHALPNPEEPLVVPDATKDDRFRENPHVTGDYGIRFYCGVPIIIDGSAVGTVCALDQRPRHPSPAQVGALVALARQAEALLKARRAAAMARQSERRFRGAVSASLDAFMLFQPVEEGDKIVDLRFGYANDLAGEYFDTHPDAMIGNTVLDLFPTENAHKIVEAFGRVLRTGVPLETEMLSQMPGKFGRWVRVQAVRVGNEIAFASRDIHDQRAQSERMDAYAAEMGETNMLLEAHRYQLEMRQRALEEANARLELLATTDGLTGLANHRTFQERLAEEIERSHRSQLPLSLVLSDVDRFKSFNDDHGHQAGDAVLRKVAKTLHETARPGDLVARYGGEEFVAILPGAQPEDAVAAAERLRVAVADASWETGPVTASFGVSTWVSGMPRETLIQAADLALYESKRQGRNRTTHARSLSPVCTF